LRPMTTSPVDLRDAVAPGLLRRLAAIFYDTILVLSLMVAAFALVYLPLAMGLGIEDLREHPVLSHLLFLWMLAVGAGFHLWFWTHGGQTLGMRAWRLKLVQADGRPITWPQAGLRVLTAIPAWLVGIIGIALATGISLSSQAWLQPFATWPRGSILLAGIAWLVIDHWPGGWRDKLTGTRVVLLPPIGK